MPFDAAAASRAAAAEMEAEDQNSEVVMQVLMCLPNDTRLVGSRGVAGGARSAGNIEAVLGFDPRTERVSVVDESELEGLVHLKHGIMVASNLSGGALLSLSLALTKVPDASCPLILAAVTFALLQLAVKGFTRLSILQQAAVAVLFIPSPAGFTTLNEVAEALELIDLKETASQLSHVSACHDEGADKQKRNNLLLYLILLVHGMVQRRFIGCVCSPPSRTFPFYLTLTPPPSLSHC